MDSSLPEEAVLFASAELGQFHIKPWTLKQFHTLYPLLRGILAKLQEQGLSFDNADTFFLENGLAALQEVLPALPELLAKSLRLEVKEIEELPWDQAVALAVQVFMVNIGVLKNFSSLIVASADTIRTTTP